MKLIPEKKKVVVPPMKLGICICHSWAHTCNVFFYYCSRGSQL
jgi:hypothetical protein